MVLASFLVGQFLYFKMTKQSYMSSIEFEEPNLGINKAKVTITATAFVDDYPVPVELRIYGDNNTGKVVDLKVPATPLGRRIYNFFKNEIFKSSKQIREPTVSFNNIFSQWRLEPEEIEKILTRAENFMGQAWKEAFKAEKKK